MFVDTALTVLQDLTANSVVFSHLIEEYGSIELKEELDEASLAGKRSRKTKGFTDESAEDGVFASKRAECVDAGGREEHGVRDVGGVPQVPHVCWGAVWAPTILLLLTVTQGAQGWSSLPLTYAES